MLRFVHDTQTQRVQFVSGRAADVLNSELGRLGAARVMVIAASAKTDLAEQVSAQLPVVLRWNEVVMHVPLEVARRARDAATDHRVDAIVSVGGGSTIGLAKAVALSSGLPIVAVPTTYAGSEATSVWGLTEGKSKTTGVDMRVLPRSVVYDATLTLSLPMPMTAASGLNAMAHCVEAMWGPNSDPIDRTLAAEGISALATGLRALVADPADLMARQQVLYGSYLSGVSFSSAGSGLHHKICHVLGGALNLPHAQTHAVVLPYVLAFNASAAGEAEERIAAAFGVCSALEGLEELRHVLGAPKALRDFGMSERDIDEVAPEVVRAVGSANPRPVTVDHVARLLRAAWGGDDPRTMADDSRALVHGGNSVIRPVTEEQHWREQALADLVVASFQNATDIRLRDLMQSLIRYLHAYLREVRLTELEWSSAIEFLTAVGHITDARRQEFVLLSDVLGASMQTVAINNQACSPVTESTVLGPFYVHGSPEIPLGGDIAFGAAGQPCWVHGTVTDADGRPVPAARIEVWEADADGLYDVQYDDHRTAARGHLFSDQSGNYRFWGITPTPYPIPHDGPVGALLKAVGRSPMRASHLHFDVRAESMRRLITHIFVRGDELLAADAVFGVKESLVYDFVQHRAGTLTPDGRALPDISWASVQFDIVLAPQHAERVAALPERS